MRKPTHRELLWQGASTLVELIYGYNDANGKKTGQLLSLTDNKNSRRNRNYSYDKLGRLSQVIGTAASGTWQQSYSYDRYGNRTSVTRSGAGASVVPLDAIADTGNPNTSTLLYNTASNRITNADYSYDAAGNLTKGQAPDGSWQ
jgi:YD repeat-containing protein